MNRIGSTRADEQGQPNQSFANHEYPLELFADTRSSRGHFAGVVG
jgi:hypothetical protein